MANHDLKYASRLAEFRKAHDARLEKLRIQMRQIKGDLDNMRFMLILSRYNGYYCQECSPKRKSGACGPTCPLLRPDSYKGDSTVLTPLDPRIRTAVMAQNRKYVTIAAALKQRGNIMSLTEIEKWESTVNEWRRKGENPSERWFGYIPMSIELGFGVVDWNGKKSRDRPCLKRKLTEYASD
jgi:hypothetical protein